MKHFAILRCVAVLLTAASAHSSFAQSMLPEVGQKAPDVSLPSIGGASVKLSSLFGSGPIALVVLRGYPGYQCPFCNRQAQDLIKSAPALRAAGLRVVMIYPGPPQDLNMRAQEFLAGKTLLEGVEMLLDPDYRFTNLYGLRWEGPRETAYPSTFLVDQRGVVIWSKISKEHGGRATASEILEAFQAKKMR